MKVGVRVGDLVFWREKTMPFVQVQRGEESMHHWERIEDPNRSVFLLLEALEVERASNDRLSEQCADLGRRVLSMELGA